MLELPGLCADSYERCARSMVGGEAKGQFPRWTVLAEGENWVVNMLTTGVL